MNNLTKGLNMVNPNDNVKAKAHAQGLSVKAYLESLPQKRTDKEKERIQNRLAILQK